MEDAERSSLVHILAVMRRRWVILLVIPLVAAAVGYGLTKREHPRYEATAILLAGQGGSKVGTIDQVDSATTAAVALSAMATDRVVIGQALLRVDGNDRGAQELARRTSVSVPTDSQKIEITVLDESPRRAARLANAIARSFAELVTQDQVARLNLSATMWQPAISPTDPSWPSVPLVVLAALAVGVLTAASLAAAREALDATWRSERDVESSLDVPVLVVIPALRVPRRPRIGTAR